MESRPRVADGTGALGHAGSGVARLRQRGGAVTGSYYGDAAGGAAGAACRLPTHSPRCGKHRHVVEVPQRSDGGGTLLAGDHRYRLVQWHLHAPSEHVLHGHRADLEVHLVHQDEQGQNAVLAVFADAVASASAAPQTPAADLLRTTIQAAPGTAGEEIDLGQHFSAAGLLGAAIEGRDRDGVISDYLTYTGSLTTPPCTGGVRWFLVPGLLGVDAASVQRLHALIASFPGYDGYPDNNRPVQSLGSRTVTQRVN